MEEHSASIFDPHIVNIELSPAPGSEGNCDVDGDAVGVIDGSIDGTAEGLADGRLEGLVLIDGAVLLSMVGPPDNDGISLGVPLGLAETLGDALVDGLILCSFVGDIEEDGDELGSELGTRLGFVDGLELIEGLLL